MNPPSGARASTHWPLLPDSRKPQKSADPHAHPCSAVHCLVALVTVRPYVTVRDLDSMLAFLISGLAAELTLRHDGHAELRIGDPTQMIGGGPGAIEHTGAFHFYAPDCDATFAQAIASGAESMGEPADRPYGERSAFVKDFAGNHWYIATDCPYGRSAIFADPFRHEWVPISSL